MNRHDARWTRAVLERIRRVMPGLHGTLPRFYVVGVRSPGADLRQALASAEEGVVGKQIPLVVAFEGEDVPPIVVMRFPRFLELVMEWWQGQQGA